MTETPHSTTAATYEFDPPREGLRARTRKGAIATALGQGLDILIEIGPIVVLSRLLPPSDFGVMAMAMAVGAILAVVKEAGLSSATVQARQLNHEQVNALFWTNVLLGLSVGALSFIAGPTAAWVVSQPQLTWIIPCLGLTGIIDCFGIQHDALLQRKLEFRKIVTRQLTARSLGVAAGITAALYGAGIWSLVIMQAVSAITGTVTLWIACGWRPGRPSNLAAARPLVRFGVNILLERLLGQTTRGMDTLVIGYFHGSVATGLYARAQGLIGKPLARVLAPIMNVSRPALSRAADDPQRFEQAAADVLSLVSVFTALIVAVLASASDGIVRLLLGPAWSAAVPIFSALAIFAMVEPCASIMASLVIAAGRPDALLRWRMISVVIVLTGLLLSAPYGVVVIAYAYAGLGLAVRMPAFLWYGCRAAGLPFGKLFHTIWPPVLSGAIAVGASHALRTQFDDPATPLAAVALGATAAAVYLGVCLALPRTRQSLWLLAEQIAPRLRQRSAGKPNSEPATTT
ncbi:lipopolysaccharide biosynthesis protein (plasmid) [Bryobacterales bacterium F-183]|nr:lipopolysaccharide biosynthesis protein [Bryobacterales bacterium F-183]